MLRVMQIIRKSKEKELEPHSGNLYREGSVKNTQNLGKERLIKAHEQSGKSKRLDPSRHAPCKKSQHGALYSTR